VRRWLFDLLKGSRTDSRTELAKHMDTSRARLNTALKMGTLSPENIDALGVWLGGVDRVYEELRKLAVKMQDGAVPKLTAIEIESLKGKAGRLKGRAGTTRPISGETPSSPHDAPADDSREPALPTTRLRLDPEGTGKRSR
jgi:hypothetical protein